VFQAVPSPYLVPFDGSYQQADTPTAPPGDAPSGRKKALKKRVERFAELQERLYAEDKRSLLLVFQAMDAAGKDSTIRAITSGVSAAGFQVSAFKRPSDRELDHDFLWRTVKQLPQRGRIGIFNRSYYEEVLVVRVHPGIIGSRPRPGWMTPGDELWEHRFESIHDHEMHLARAGTTILKFWFLSSIRFQWYSGCIDRCRRRWRWVSRQQRATNRWWWRCRWVYHFIRHFWEKF